MMIFLMEMVSVMIRLLFSMRLIGGVLDVVRFVNSMVLYVVRKFEFGRIGMILVMKLVVLWVDVMKVI